MFNLNSFISTFFINSAKKIFPVTFSVMQVVINPPYMKNFSFSSDSTNNCNQQKTRLDIARMLTLMIYAVLTASLFFTALLLMPFMLAVDIFNNFKKIISFGTSTKTEDKKCPKAAASCPSSRPQPPSLCVLEGVQEKVFSDPAALPKQEPKLPPKPQPKSINTCCMYSHQTRQKKPAPKASNRCYELTHCYK